MAIPLPAAPAEPVLCPIQLADANADGWAVDVTTGLILPPPDHSWYAAARQRRDEIARGWPRCQSSLLMRH